MHGIEEVEGPLDGLAVGGLAAIVEADGHHGQCAHDLDGHGNPADLPGVAADHPADDEDADGLRRLGYSLLPIQIAFLSICLLQSGHMHLPYCTALFISSYRLGIASNK